MHLKFIGAIKSDVKYTYNFSFLKTKRKIVSKLNLGNSGIIGYMPIQVFSCLCNLIVDLHDYLSIILAIYLLIRDP